jgi:RimJ/RimL family protein N-acetyltransferase
MATDLRPPAEIPTTHLLLSAACKAHVASLFHNYTGDSHTARYLTRLPHSSASQTDAMIGRYGENNWLNSERFAWSIIDRSSGEAIGLFLLFVIGEDAEIHYGLGSAFWGRGWATEAGLAVMEWVRERSQLTTVHTTCAVANLASCRVLEKIGLVREAGALAAVIRAGDGKTFDAWSYVWEREGHR